MRDLFNSIKWFIQRGRRGYADCDVWGFDEYLNGVILEGLKRLQKDKYGYPGSLKNPEQWTKILQEMIDGFEAYQAISEHTYKYLNSDGEREYNHEHTQKLYQKHQKGLKLFVKYYSALWD